MLGDPLERPAGVLVRVSPGVVDVESGTVVDQPRPAMPDEQVRVLRRAVGVGDQRIEPDHVGREVGVDDLARGRGGRVERERPGQEVHPEVEAAALADQVVDLLVGLRVAERRVDLDPDEIGDGQADRPRQLPGQPLRDEGARPLTGTAELDDVQPVVVRLDQPGQGATLAQGRHVARGNDGPHHAAERSGLPDQLRRAAVSRAACRPAHVRTLRRPNGATLRG